MIPAWLVIGVAAVLIGVGLNQLIKSDQRWFFRLRRPAWLTFEWAIPIIWTIILLQRLGLLMRSGKRNPEVYDRFSSWWVMPC